MAVPPLAAGVCSAAPSFPAVHLLCNSSTGRGGPARRAHRRAAHPAQREARLTAAGFEGQNCCSEPYCLRHRGAAQAAPGVQSLSSCSHAVRGSHPTYNDVPAPERFACAAWLQAGAEAPGAAGHRRLARKRPCAQAGLWAAQPTHQQFRSRLSCPAAPAPWSCMEPLAVPPAAAGGPAPQSPLLLPLEPHAYRLSLSISQRTHQGLAPGARLSAASRPPRRRQLPAARRPAARQRQQASCSGRARMSCTSSMAPVPTPTGRPSTMRAAGEVRASTSPCSVADTRKEAAVSKDIFRKGDVQASMPMRLQAR